MTRLPRFPRPRSYVKILAFALILLCPLTGEAQQRPPAEPFPAELDRYLAGVREDWSIPGLAIAVVRNDSTLVAKGYGVRELGKPGLVDAHTVFDIASLAKSFTATAAAILVDRGALRWDDPVRRWLPDLVLPDSFPKDATVRDFLSHRTGLEAANTMWVQTALTRREVLQRVRFLRVAAPFRQTMTYSNVGYTVAGEAIAAAFGRSYEELLRELVIQPLGLRSTTASYEEAADLPNLAAPHATIAGRQQPIRRETQRHSTGPAGGVQSNLADLTRWMRLHLNHGELDGTRWISDSAMRAMHTIQVPIETTPPMRAARLVQDSIVGYGMGWQIMDYRGHPLHWHTGNGGGQIVFMALLPRDRLGVVVLVNTWSAPLVHAALINRIVDTYLGYPPRDWAGEALARVPPMVQAQDSAQRAADAMKSNDPPPFPLAAYQGRFDHALFGPVWIRLESTGLTLQVGGGRIADLEFHGENSFYTRWRDPVAREFSGTHVNFNAVGDSIASLTVRINRDEFTAMRAAGRPPT